MVEVIITLVLLAIGVLLYIKIFKDKDASKTDYLIVPDQEGEGDSDSDDLPADDDDAEDDTTETSSDKDNAD